MGKKISHFLFPVLAIIFSIICTYDNAAFFQNTTHGLNITEASAGHNLPFSSDLRKSTRKVNIHAIRVKARQDAFAANIPTLWEPAIHVDHATQCYYTSYSAYELYAHLSGYNLRGPPQA